MGYWLGMTPDERVCLRILEVEYFGRLADGAAEESTDEVRHQTEYCIETGAKGALATGTGGEDLVFAFPASGSFRGTLERMQEDPPVCRAWFKVSDRAW